MAEWLSARNISYSVLIEDVEALAAAQLIPGERPVGTLAALRVSFSFP